MTSVLVALFPLYSVIDGNHGMWVAFNQEYLFSVKIRKA